MANGEIVAAPGQPDDDHNRELMKPMGGELSIKEIQSRVARVEELLFSVMKEDKDYGKIPGCGDKPALLKPGAELIGMMFQLVPDLQVKTIDLSNGHREYETTTTLIHGPTGRFWGKGIGTCSTMEKKYRWRLAQRKCPECKKEAIAKGSAQFGGGFYCNKRAGGCGAKFDDNAKAIVDQIVGRIENEDIADVYNTCLKMSKKRCLGANTEVLIKTRRGPIRCKLSQAYSIYHRETQHENKWMQIAGPNGEWRNVLGMVREERPTGCVRLELADGTRVYASDEHRFPTTNGLKHVSELSVGDSLLRSKISTGTDGTTDLEIGWLVGFYLAEGFTIKSGRIVNFAVCTNEQEFTERVVSFAEKFGGRTRVHDRNKTRHIRVCSAAFAGLMYDFIDGSSCYDKHLSRIAWKQGDQFLAQVMRGYLDGDGHLLRKSSNKCRKQIVGFTGKNRELAEDIRALSAILGYRCRLHRKTAAQMTSGFTTFTGWVSEDEPLYNFKNLEEIVAIDPVNRPSVVYDIEVDADHLFCLANGIVTHNSHVDAILTAAAASRCFTQDQDEFEKWRDGELADEYGGDDVPAKKIESTSAPIPQQQAATKENTVGVQRILNYFEEYLGMPAAEVIKLAKTTPENWNDATIAMLREQGRKLLTEQTAAARKALWDACMAMDEVSANKILEAHGIAKVEDIDKCDKLGVLRAAMKAFENRGEAQKPAETSAPVNTAPTQPSGHALELEKQCEAMFSDMSLSLPTWQKPVKDAFWPRHPAEDKDWEVCKACMVALKKQLKDKRAAKPEDLKPFIDEAAKEGGMIPF